MSLVSQIRSTHLGQACKALVQTALLRSGYEIRKVEGCRGRYDSVSL